MAAVDFAAADGGFDACGDEVAAAGAVLFPAFFGLRLSDGFLRAQHGRTGVECEEHREYHCGLVLLSECLVMEMADWCIGVGLSLLLRSAA